MEKVEISKHGTEAKIVGTGVAFAGAALMTLYKDINLISTHSSIDRKKHSHQTTSKLSLDKKWIEGSLRLFLFNFSLSAFYILQKKKVKMYPAPITLTLLTCLSGTLLSAIMAALLDHKASSWSLSWNITLLAPHYTGVVIFTSTVYVQTLVTRQRGPVFVTKFRPLSTIIVAIFGLLILGEALHLGSIVGAMLIILGLYAILSGKEKEEKQSTLEQ